MTKAEFSQAINDITDKLSMRKGTYENELGGMLHLIAGTYEEAPEHLKDLKLAMEMYVMTNLPHLVTMALLNVIDLIAEHPSASKEELLEIIKQRESEFNFKVGET
jgi:hypothetical protein